MPSARLPGVSHLCSGEAELNGQRGIQDSPRTASCALGGIGRHGACHGACFRRNCEDAGGRGDE